MNINIGDLINQTGFTHYTPNLQVRFGVPKGRVSVMLMLGDADKKAPEAFDAKAALNNLGWIEETRLTAAQSELAALREELAKTREAAKEELEGVKYARRKFRQERDDLQQRLTAAEQRNAALIDALTEERRIRLLGQQENVNWESLRDCRLACYAKTDAALKPTEPGASE